MGGDIQGPSKNNHSSVENSASVHQFLKDVKKRIRFLCEADKDSPMGQMVRNHFLAEGKMFRPIMILSLAETLDLDARNVQPWAEACEILHNATLIHDDIQDGDEVRRGRPSLWKIFGKSQALNTGDYLLMTAPLAMIRSHWCDEKVRKLLDIFFNMSRFIAEGQAKEIELNSLKNLENLMKKYELCIAHKTSILFSKSAQGVAILASRSVHEIVEIENVFFELGHVFQIQDDILDLYGNKNRGEVGCDLKEGKVSYLIANHLSHFPNDVKIIKDILHKKRDETTSENIEFIKQLFEEKGTLKLCITLLEKRVSKIKSNVFVKENKKFALLIERSVDMILASIGNLMGKEN